MSFARIRRTSAVLLGLAAPSLAIFIAAADPVQAERGNNGNGIGRGNANSSANSNANSGGRGSGSGESTTSSNGAGSSAPDKGNSGRGHGNDNGNGNSGGGSNSVATSPEPTTTTSTATSSRVSEPDAPRETPRNGNSVPARLAIYREDYLAAQSAREAAVAAFENYQELSKMSEYDITRNFPLGGHGSAVNEAGRTYNNLLEVAQESQLRADHSLRILTEGRTLTEQALLDLHRMLGLV